MLERATQKLNEFYNSLKLNKIRVWLLVFLKNSNSIKLEIGTWNIWAKTRKPVYKVNLKFKKKIIFLELDMCPYSKFSSSMKCELVQALVRGHHSSLVLETSYYVLYIYLLESLIIFGLNNLHLYRYYNSKRYFGFTNKGSKCIAYELKFSTLASWYF